MEKNGEIFALRHQNVDYFPLYGLEASNSYRPCSGLAAIIKVLAKQKDGWGMAFWFASPDSYLGRPPKEVLPSAPERVLAAAEDEVAGIIHG